MGIKIKRNKPRHFLLTLIYRSQRLLPLSKKKKFKLFLDLEWIFDRLSHEASFAFYNEENHPIRLYSKNFILDHLDETHKVLDLGCKYGEMTNHFASKAKDVIGIDHDQKAIEIANSKYNKENLNFIHADAFDYLTKNAIKFDVLILSHILEHLDNLKDFIKQFFNYIYIEVPDFERYYLNLYRVDQKSQLIYSDDDHVSEFDRDELKLLLKENGISILESEYRFGVQKLWCKVN